MQVEDTYFFVTSMRFDYYENEIHYLVDKYFEMIYISDVWEEIAKSYD